ncbi:MAG TPA: DUF167 domain-containing protein [Candidatus Limnocylindrales bacterium]
MTVRESEVRFAVRLTPRGGRDAVDGVLDGELRARVSARAIDGAANEALRVLVAAELGVPPSSVRLVAGSSGRRKLIAVAGLAPSQLIARWPGLAV